MAKFHMNFVIWLVALTVNSCLFTVTHARSNSSLSDRILPELAACGAKIFVFGRNDAFSAAYHGFRTGTENVTKDQVVSACQIIQGFIGCMKDYADRHIGQDNVEAHEITRGTVKLMEICDKPDLYEKATKMASCGRTLRASPGYRTCIDNGKNALRYLEFEHNPNKTLVLLRAGGVLKDLCCLAKDVRTCITPELQKCSSDEVALRNEVYDNILATYGCAAKTADGCPVRVYPTTTPRPRPRCMEDGWCVDRDGAPKSTAGVLLCGLAVAVLFFIRPN